MSIAKNAQAKSRVQLINSIFSAGLADNIDVIITLPYERRTERSDSIKTTVAGYTDMEISTKWRFYKKDALSFAMRAGLGIPTANEDQGLGGGHVIPSLFAVTTYAIDPWAFHLHVGYTFNPHPAAGERSDTYHGSIAAEYSVSERLRIVSDLSTERSGHPSVGSMVIGLVYSFTPNLNFRFWLSQKASPESGADHAYLLGLALRFY